MTDIFLSYNREDQARAKLFAEAFEAQGFKVWWDVGLRTGEAYDQVTEKALKTAKAVVVLWSKKSVESRCVRAEATLADRNKTLVPCMIETCERPIMFELTQTAELTHWQGDATDKAWVAFLAGVRRFVAKEIVPAAAPTTSPLAAPTVEETLKTGQSGSAPSLAVLPFTNRSQLSEDEVFAEVMVEDVISALKFDTFGSSEPRDGSSSKHLDTAELLNFMSLSGQRIMPMLPHRNASVFSNKRSMIPGNEVYKERLLIESELHTRSLIYAYVIVVTAAMKIDPEFLSSPTSGAMSDSFQRLLEKGWLRRYGRDVDNLPDQRATDLFTDEIVKADLIQKEVMDLMFAKHPAPFEPLFRYLDLSEQRTARGLDEKYGPVTRELLKTICGKMR